MASKELPPEVVEQLDPEDRAAYDRFRANQRDTERVAGLRDLTMQESADSVLHPPVAQKPQSAPVDSATAAAKALERPSEFVPPHRIPGVTGLMSLLNGVTFQEPSVEEVQNMLRKGGPEMAATADQLTDKSPLYQHYANARYAQAYDDAVRRGVSIQRPKLFPKMGVDLLTGAETNMNTGYDRILNGVSGGIIPAAMTKFNRAVGDDARADQIEYNVKSQSPLEEVGTDIATAPVGMGGAVAGRAAELMGAAKSIPGAILKGAGAALGTGATMGALHDASEGVPLETMGKNAISRGTNPITATVGGVLGGGGKLVENTIRAGTAGHELRQLEAGGGGTGVLAGLKGGPEVESNVEAAAKPAGPGEPVLTPKEIAVQKAQEALLPQLQKYSDREYEPIRQTAAKMYESPEGQERVPHASTLQAAIGWIKRHTIPGEETKVSLAPDPTEEGWQDVHEHDLLPEDHQAHFDEAGAKANQVAQEGGFHETLDRFLNRDRQRVGQAEQAGLEDPTSTQVTDFLREAQASGATFGGPVYRGASQAELEHVLSTGENPSTWSVSKDPEGATRFAKKGGVLLEIGGQHGAVPVDHIEGSNTFGEALVPRGTQWRVAGEDTRDGLRVVKLEAANGPHTEREPEPGPEENYRPTLPSPGSPIPAVVPNTTTVRTASGPIPFLGSSDNKAREVMDTLGTWEPMTKSQATTGHLRGTLTIPAKTALEQVLVTAEELEARGVPRNVPAGEYVIAYRPKGLNAEQSDAVIRKLNALTKEGQRTSGEHDPVLDEFQRSFRKDREQFRSPANLPEVANARATVDGHEVTGWAAYQHNIAGKLDEIKATFRRAGITNAEDLGSSMTKDQLADALRGFGSKKERDEALLKLAGGGQAEGKLRAVTATQAYEHLTESTSQPGFLYRMIRRGEYHADPIVRSQEVKTAVGVAGAHGRKEEENAADEFAHRLRPPTQSLIDLIRGFGQ